MIDMQTLTQDHIGKWVIYNDGFREPEKGRIKSWNERFIFVVYERPGRDMNLFEHYTAVATNPEDLEWL